MQWDEIISVLGEFGRFQIRICIVVCIFALVSSWHDLNMVFVGAIPKFRCKNFGFNQTGTTLTNMTYIEKVEITLLNDSSCYQKEVIMSLSDVNGSDRHVIILNDNYMLNVTQENVTCHDGYEFSKSTYSETIVSEFQLVCDKKYWTRVASSTFFVGRLIGSIIFGQLSDRSGRKRVFLAGCFLLLISGTLAAFAPNIYVFLPMYFCQGAANMMTETVCTNYRVPVWFVIYIFYNSGYIVLAVFAYFIRHWRYIEMTITLPVALIIQSWWLVYAMVYYGLSLYTENLAGNIYINFGISGAVDIPANVIANVMLILSRAGRRRPLVNFMYLAGIACILSECITDNAETIQIILVLFGKFAITASFGVSYLMAAELFPTLVRSAGLGVASMCSGAGAIIAPIVLHFQIYFNPLPLIVFGSFSIVAGSLALMLPETNGQTLPQTLDEVEAKGY
ncbi:hypothetical protein Btru_029229 [Bulinus truncatus]|nr:hypothetical protein Btru_029229 [Bulinus truncatus]